MKYLSTLESYIPDEHTLNVEIDYRMMYDAVSVWVHVDKEQTYKEIAYLDRELFDKWVFTNEARKYVQNKIHSLMK